MKEMFSNENGILVVQKVITSIQENRQYLGEIDSKGGGDGDHGINMNKGFTIAKEEIMVKNIQTMSEGFKVISNVLVNIIGGSMGPLYGNFFRGLSVASKKETIITKEIMGKMLNEGFQNLSILTEAKIGDKTLMDVLIPAVETYQSKVDKLTFEDCLSAMLESAEKGLKSTKQMPAKIGRASRIGERSIGHQDAGATSCYLILKALTESIIQLLKE
ncbi:dihydroxyacetone kinase subunit L [Tetragenococcus halophilus subsp. flandriensis]|uniref:dihydroxyacetone kinase subunit DhaL n=1 Tax=Tetragenococcus halophilus TaxID=51669 RepID=UPI0023E9D048|nr:dihydroxyacetone kinase subunit DhaL [Tetragenococcus halophilus]GMA08817.1 dihydroxyacetone kinase subunit L [Tetragenococcus halophilus subsp. flandriensis]